MDLRTLTSDDLDGVDTLRPEDWAPYRLVFSRYLTLPFCTPYGIFFGDRLAATGTLIRFGTSAWVAQLITAQDYRCRGLGTKLLRFLVDESDRAGVKSLSLVATDQGYPLYASAKFRVEGEYAFWTRKTPAPAEPGASEGLEPWNPGEISESAALDRVVSGEDRVSWWGDLTSGGQVWKTGGDLEGFYFPGLGEGLVAAKTDRAGIPLLHRRIDGSDRVVIPSGHVQARKVLESRGFSETKRARRMILGKSLDRNPSWVWSRIAGNLG